MSVKKGKVKLDFLWSYNNHKHMVLSVCHSVQPFFGRYDEQNRKLRYNFCTVWCCHQIEYLFVRPIY